MSQIKSIHEAWVTYAGNDEEAKQALILLRSLRRVCTNRQVILIVHPTLSQSLWKPLKASFDGVSCLTPSGNGFVIDATIFAMSLFSFKKLVLLPPSALILENCDILFSKSSFTLGTETGTLILAPEFEQHLNVWNTFGELKNGEKTDGLDKLFKVLQSLNKVSKLEEVFDFVVNSTSVQLCQEELLIKNPKIVHLQNVDSLLAQNGHLAPFFKAVWNVQKELLGEVDDFIKNATDLGGSSISWKRFENEPIAIVGMSCKMPASDNAEEYWKLLMEGRCGVRDLPEGRWTKEQGFVLTPEHKKVQAGFLSSPVDEFDAKFFGISPAESEFTDPQQRVLLEATWLALEDAGINPQTLDGNYTGVFTGAWLMDYRDRLRESGLQAKDSFRAYMGNSYGTMAARIAHFLGVTGPNISTESGCSSSSVAVGLAVHSLRKGEVNMALACGVNLLVYPFTLEKFAGILSTESRSKVFDADANGFARAEGCGVFVLKRFSDAVKDGDHIHALIRGFGMSQEGKSRSMGTPTVDGEALAMQLALNDAHVLAKDVQIVEAHGTGTAVGDPLEIKAITQVYTTPERDVPLIITAGKANIGHTESASGIAGMIKTILEIKHQMIPPQTLITNLNPHIDLEKIPAEITYSLKPWEPKGPRIAGVSSFGITGTNTHVIMQETPQLPKADWKYGVLNSPPQNILTLSAKSEEALDEMTKLIENYLEEKKTTESLDSVCYSANTGRAHFQHRLAIWGKDCQEVLDKLGKGVFETGVVALNEDQPQPNLCFLFTGQGSQFHGMGKVLYNTCPVFKVNFDRCENILKSLYGLELKDALWGADSTKLHKSLYSQSAIFVMEYCLVKLWESWGVVPSSVVGHSLGEFGAATTAGILSVEDALKLLGARCRLIDGLPRGKMVAVKADEKKALELVASFVKQHKDTTAWLDVAAVNSADQTTLSGPEEVMPHFAVYCEKCSIKAHILDATHAFHSRAMDPILQEYRRVAESITYHPATIHFISGVEGKAMEKINAEYWVRHTREGVQFSKAAAACFVEVEKQPIFLEVGPHPVLSALVHANAPPTAQNIKCFPSIRKPPAAKSESTGPVETIEWQTMLDALCKLEVAGVPINFKEFHRFQPKQRVPLPSYPFQRKRFWMAYQGYNVSTRQYHPLLGSKVNSPKSPDHDIFDNCRQTRFQNYVTTKTNRYIVDHKVGNYAILPAAGFVEMFLAAVSSVAVNELPLILENVLIKAAFLVEDVAPRELHTVLTLDNENHSVVKLTAFGREVDAKPNAKWTIHSESTATLSMSTVQNMREELAVEDFAELKERLFAETPTNLEIYKEMATQGYNFGKLFQTLGTMWTKGRERLTEIAFPTDLQDERDMCHPVLIDSMIQALLLNSLSSKVNGLYLPVSVKKFVLLDSSFYRVKEEEDENTKFFVHVKDLSATDETEQVAILYKSDGTPVASMYGVELVKTQLAALEKRLEAARKELPLPPLHEEEWRRSPTFNPVQIEKAFISEQKEEIKALADAHPAYEEGDEYYIEMAKEGVGLSMVYEFHQLGMKRRTIGMEFSVQDFMKELEIQEQLLLPMRRYLEIFCEDGYLKQSLENRDQFQVVKEVPTEKELNDKLSQKLECDIPVKRQAEQRYFNYLKIFGACLTGKDNVLNYLFPQEATTSEFATATEIFAETKMSTRNYIVMQTILPQIVSQLVSCSNGAEGKSGMIRILEIGAGTGSATRPALEVLAKMDNKFSYTFTDVSNIFFFKAREQLTEYSNQLEYKVLNIEEDPKTQGFAPNQFDLILAANVLHATRNLSETCRNIRLLMKNHGVLFIAEGFKPNRLIDITFGLLPGYWRQNDLDIRPRHCLIDGKTWTEVLEKNGFKGNIVLHTNSEETGVVVAQASGTVEQYVPPLPAIEDEKSEIKKEKNAWLVFGDASPFVQALAQRITLHGKSILMVEQDPNGFGVGKNKFQIRGDSKEDFALLFETFKNNKLQEEIEGIVFCWSEGLTCTEKCEESAILYMHSFLFLVQSMLEGWANKFPKLVLITRGASLIGDQSPTLPSVSPMSGIFRTFLSENREVSGRNIDLSPDENNVELDVLQVVSELWSDDNHQLVAYRGGIRLKECLVYCQPRLGLPYPAMELEMSPSARRFHVVIPDTHSIADLKFETHNNKNALRPFEVEVEVKACALNFRDVLSVLKPTKQFDDINAIGVDICGTVVAIGSEVTGRKLGDVVLGCNYHNLAMPSHVVLPALSTVLLPPTMTYIEGATLPTVFVTAYHCLVTVGKLQAGQTILIHTTSGGVGLCALQIARDIGAKVVGTAGSKRKRAHLNLLGVTDVFNSRYIVSIRERQEEVHN